MIPDSPAPPSMPCKNWGPQQTITIPDKLNPDWCRFRTGGACCLAGDVLAEEAGVTVLGVTDTSHTGPSYRPRGTPLSSASCKTQEPLDSGHAHRGRPLTTLLMWQSCDVWGWGTRLMEECSGDRCQHGAGPKAPGQSFIGHG